MTRNQLEEIPPDVRTMLEAERRAPAMPAASAERLLARIGTGVVIGAAATTVAASAGKTWATVAGGIAVKKAATVLVVLAGLGAGAAGARFAWSHWIVPASSDTAPPPTVAKPPAVAGATPRSVASQTAGDPVATPPGSAPAAAIEEIVAAPTGTASAAKALAPSAPHDNLAAEQILLEEARAATARGDSNAALIAIQQHAKQFPSGGMTEERESLRIYALVRAGRYTEARSRADGFRARYPKSIFLPAVESALSAIPEDR